MCLFIFLSMYVPTYLSITLSFSPLLIFFQSLHLFPGLPLFSSIYVSFSLSFPSFPNSLSLPLSVFTSSPFSPWCFLFFVLVEMRWIGLQDPCHKMHRTAWHQSERRVNHGLRALKYQINCASAYYKSVTLTEVDLIYIMTGIELMCGQDDKL